MFNAEDIETDSSKKLLNDWLRNENVQIIKRSSQYHIKEEVHARLIKAGEAVQHDDLSICLDHLIKYWLTWIKTSLDSVRHNLQYVSPCGFW